MSVFRIITPKSLRSNKCRWHPHCETVAGGSLGRKRGRRGRRPHRSSALASEARPSTTVSGTTAVRKLEREGMPSRQNQGYDEAADGVVNTLRSNALSRNNPQHSKP